MPSRARSIPPLASVSSAASRAASPAPGPDAARGWSRRELLRGGVAAAIAGGSGARFARAASAPEPVGPDGAVIWENVRGVNYMPSKASSPRRAWLDYDRATVRLELLRAWRLGFDAVRVHASFLAWEEAPSRYLENFADFVEACSETGLWLVPVLFDCWGVEFDPLYQREFVGKNDDPTQSRRETVAAAYERFRSRPDAYRIDAKAYERKFGYLAKNLMPGRSTPVTSDAGSVFWGEWAPSPGLSRMNDAGLPRCLEFARSALADHDANPTILAWDVMNAPDAARIVGPPPPFDPILDFVTRTLRALRETSPRAPLIVSAAGGFHGSSAFALRTDATAFHYFDTPPANVVAHVRAARRENRVPVVTAIGANLFPGNADEASPERQAEIVRQAVMYLERDRVGFFLFHLHAGKGLAPWAALLEENGSRRPAAAWLASYWGGR